MTRILLLVAPGFLAAVVSFLLTPLAAWIAKKVGAIDTPGERKVHTQPIPRMGGLAVVASAGLLLGLSRVGAVPLGEWEAPGLGVGIVWGLLPIFVVSVWDDIRTLPPAPKFAAQFLGAGIAVWNGIVLPPVVHLFGEPIELGWLAVVVSVFWLVGVTNAFNLVDGLDGLAAGLALISAGCLSAAFFIAGRHEVGAATMVIAGAIVGFLPWNFHPAKVFLGDTGSTAIGFTLAALALKGGSTLSAGFAVLVPVLILGLPVAETLVSMARRAVKRVNRESTEGLFAGDRGHFHHRLLLQGFGQRKAVLLLYAVAMLLAAVGLLSLFLQAQQTALLVVALVFAGLVGISRLGYDEFALLRKGTVLRLYEVPVLRKTFFTVFVDIVLVAVAVWISIGVKYDQWGIGPFRGMAVEMVTVLAPTMVAGLWMSGLYRGAWRLASLDNFLRLGLAVGGSTLAGLALDRFLLGGSIPLTLFLIYFGVKAILSSATRVSYRVLYLIKRRAEATGRPVVLYGAGSGGATALRELELNDVLTMNPVAFLDDDKGKVGVLVNGVRVVGPLERLPELARRHKGLTLIVASRKIGSGRLVLATRLCRESGVRLLRLELVFRELLPAPGLTSPGLPSAQR